MKTLKKIFCKMFKKNDCSKCPYHGSYYDSFIGDGDEWCNCCICSEYGTVLGCNYPLFIRHLLAWKEKIKQARYDKQAEKAWLKDEHERGMRYYALSEEIGLALENAAEEIEDIHGKETELSKQIKELLTKLL